ncbi:pentatricopeptide repeat-containing protein At3g51320 [Durio zibethinus]|uniref:Pentatricopeptide repeat-containing protein At3g51320 n=1 Tax=Durio zibethinus TaxID=66656 RepID=A0A6P5YMG8_DURZI|nr:pentatricopeptide repeat-containing protein At3g51320 [Durio zibethinus]
MARMSIRELLRFRYNIFANPTLRFSSPFYSTSSKTLTFPHSNLWLLDSCEDIKQLFQMQAHLITSGLFHNPFWADKVLKHSSKFSNIDYTVSVFRCIDKPGTFCVNTVIKAYSFSSFPHQALFFYFRMLSNGCFVPNSYTFVPLLGSCAKIGCFKYAQKCHGQAVKFGAINKLQVQNSLIHMYGCCGVIDLAMKVLVEMSERDLVSWNSFIDGCVKVWDLSLAHKLFDAMRKKNVISWNIMINGYLKGGNPGCSLKLFREMVKTGFVGNEKTVVSVLSACCKSARLKEGRSVHGFLIKNGLKSNIIIDTALLNFYCNCQKVGLARRMFDKIKNRNLVCWNAMILGHCIHGNPEDGLKLFMDMMDQNKIREGDISPDEITFVGVLCACARAGLIAEGRNYFSQMINKFGIKPNFAHFWCMANLYVSVRLFKEAEEILRQMPFGDDDVSSDSLLWANLLSSCRFRDGVTVGERIATSLIAKEPKNFSYYQLLLNVYAVAGQWEDVARVRQIMKDRGIERVPGCNLVDLKEIVHNFKVGERWWESVEQRDAKLAELAQRSS